MAQEICASTMASKKKQKVKGGYLECFKCDAFLPWQSFSHNQRLKGEARCCTTCVPKDGLMIEEKKCGGACGCVLPQTDYSVTQWALFEGQALCNMCVKLTGLKTEEKKCAGACGRLLARTGYSPKQWHRREGQATCETCFGALECGRCHVQKSFAEFSKQKTTTPSYIKKTAKRRCNDCFDAHEAAVKASLAGHLPRKRKRLGEQSQS